MPQLKLKDLSAPAINGALHSAKRAKNDEFYTQLSDVEREVYHYRDCFRGKTVLCNCDDPEWSAFWKHFSLKFDDYGLKRLIATHYAPGERSYTLERTAEDQPPVRTELEGDGDFRSPECRALLAQADVVVTNPPFSLFREFIALLAEAGKEFLIIGNNNAITYKEVFKLIRDNRVWLGRERPKQFKQPDGSLKLFGNITWFTNLPHNKRSEELILGREYKGHEKFYPKYDNYDAIEVSKVVDIPLDYAGAMGVPITFLDKYNPQQFELIWTTDRGGDGQLEALKKPHTRFDAPVVDGKGLYKRIIIKHRRTPGAQP